MDELGVLLKHDAYQLTTKQRNRALFLAEQSPHRPFMKSVAHTGLGFVFVFDQSAGYRVTSINF